MVAVDHREVWQGPVDQTMPKGRSGSLEHPIDGCSRDDSERNNAA